MQTTEDTPASKDVIRSLRFPASAWKRIVAKAAELDIPIAAFLRNAVMAAAGVSSNEAARLRAMADQLETLHEGKSSSSKPGKGKAKSAKAKSAKGH